MTKFTHKLSKQILGPAIRILLLTLLVGFEASVALAQTRGYVTNSLDNTVSVIDPATQSVIATVPVGSGPKGVAVTPNGRFVYVVNQLGNTVSVISAASNTVVATVPVGVFPTAIAITPNGTFAYVTNTASSTISVIDTATNTVVTTMPVSSPFMLAISSSGNLGYVTHGAIVNGVTVINTATNSVVTNIPVPVDVALAAAVTPNGAFVYVTCFSFSTGPKLAVIDTASNTVAGFVPLPAGTFSQALAITPNGAFSYVANNGNTNCCGGGFVASSVSVIDTASNTEIATVPVASPLGIAVTPDGAFVYVTNINDDTITVMNTVTNTVVASVPVGNFPHSIAFGTVQEDTIESLIARVEALITGGTLTQNQGDGLIDKLGQAGAKIDAGQTSAACNQLSAFINQVTGLINNGTLTAAQGQPLINAANAIKTNLGC